MADNSGPIVISETYCRWTSYIIPEASTQPTKRIHSLFLSPPSPSHPIPSSRLSLSHFLPRNSFSLSLSLSFSFCANLSATRENPFRALLAPWSLLLFALSTRAYSLTFHLSSFPRILPQLVSSFSSLLFTEPSLVPFWSARTITPLRSLARSLVRSLALKLTLLWIDIIIVIEYLSPRGISFPNACVTMPWFKSRH